MKKALFILLFFSSIATMASRPWMDPGMEYFKIKVAKDGIYEIDFFSLSQAVQNAGFSLSNVDTSKWALFHRGEEVAIDIENLAIRFYGQKNDITLDTGLYKEADNFNEFINSHSDTSAYFFSWYTDARTGKRMNSMNINNAQPLTYLISERAYIPSTHAFTIGANLYTSSSVDLLYSTYQEGEGWVGISRAAGNQIVYYFDSINDAISSPQPILDASYLGFQNSANTGSIEIGISSIQTWRTLVSANSHEHIKESGTIPFTAIQNDSLGVFMNVQSGRIFEVDAKLTYAHLPRMHGKTSRIVFIDSLQDDNLSIILNDIPNALTSEFEAWDITDPKEVRKCPVQVLGSNEVRFDINDANSIQRRVLLTYSSAKRIVTDISFRNYQNLQNPDQDLILVYPQVFDSAAQIYANYRRSSTGGDFEPLAIDIEEVYDQFSFGEMTPVGLHELCRYLHHNSSAESNYLFILGKGFIHIANSGGKRWRFDPSAFSEKNYVLPWGYPGADWPYVMYLDDNEPLKAQFGVGRLNARSNSDIINYLEKVKEYEDPNLDGEWRKKFLHISGGKDAGEIQRFNDYMQIFGDIASGDYLGAEMEYITKRNPNTLETVIIDSTINEGIGVMTMYGHSSAFGSDIQIGSVNNPNYGYNNGDGKYPMFFINGCHTGGFYDASGPIWAETWVTEAQRGASLVLAHAHFGWDPILRFYAQKFYDVAFTDSVYFAKPVGDLLTETISRFYDEYYSFYGEFIQSQIELMTLQGDPCLKIGSLQEKTDYAIKDAGLSVNSFSSEPITSLSDSFSLAIVVNNLGKTSEEDLHIVIERQIPSYRVFDTLISAPVSRIDTIYFTIYQNENDEIIGLNRFKVSIDPANYIDESTKDNNTASVEVLVPSRRTRNINPTNYGIVNSLQVPLRAISFVEDNKDNVMYEFQLDTVHTFNSAFLKTKQITSQSVAEWNYNLISTSITGDSMVYYWRTRRTEDTIWSNSSFTLIPNGDNGWMQSEYGQLKDNQHLFGLNLNETSEELEFEEFSTGFELTYGMNTNPNNPNLTVPNYTYYSVRVNGVIQMQFGTSTNTRNCTAPSILLFRINPENGAAIRPYSDNDPNVCGVSPYAIRSFRNLEISNDTTSTLTLFNQLSDIPDDEIVVMMNYGKANLGLASDQLKDSLALFGFDSTFWANYSNNYSFIYYGKRNWDSSIFVLDTILDTLRTFEQTLFQKDNSGQIESPIIGPASLWNALRKRFTGNSNDIVDIDVFGIDTLGKKTKLFSQVSNDFQDLSQISADQYPYLQLNAQITDSIEENSPQINHWDVSYKGLPEGYLNPNAYGDSAYINLVYQEGQLISIPFSFSNISDVNFGDSLIVEFSINNAEIADSILIAAPIMQDSIQFTFEMSSVGLEGDYDLRVFVNPFEERELLYDNNITEVEFSVFRDSEPPILLATVNGERIENGEIVNPEPQIRMFMDDNNPYFFIQDSGAIFFDFYLSDGFTDSAVFIDPNAITWSPENDSLPFTVNFNPDSLAPGYYKLEYNGRDASGNIAGPFPQVLEFEIQSEEEAAIEGINIYPNPFNRSFYISFNMEGNSSDGKLKLDIANVQGQIVYKADLSSELDLGNNKIEIWNGTNGEGEILPSGLYIYNLELGLPNGRNERIIGKVLFNP